MMYPYQIDGIEDFGNILKSDNNDININFKKIRISKEGKKRSLEMNNKWIINKKFKTDKNNEYFEVCENLNKRLKIS